MQRTAHPQSKTGAVGDMPKQITNLGLHRFVRYLVEQALTSDVIKLWPDGLCIPGAEMERLQAGESALAQAAKDAVSLGLVTVRRSTPGAYCLSLSI
jgi:hypothetical protein